MSFCLLLAHLPYYRNRQASSWWSSSLSITWQSVMLSSIDKRLLGLTDVRQKRGGCWRERGSGTVGGWGESGRGRALVGEWRGSLCSKLWRCVLIVEGHSMCTAYWYIAWRVSCQWLQYNCYILHEHGRYVFFVCRSSGVHKQCWVCMACMDKFYCCWAWQIPLVCR